MQKEIELIAKQQLEIEELKMEIEHYKEICNAVRGYLWKPEQWNMKCPDFPEIAMYGIIGAIRAVDDI